MSNGSQPSSSINGVAYRTGTPLSTNSDTEVTDNPTSPFPTPPASSSPLPVLEEAAFPVQQEFTLNHNHLRANSASSIDIITRIKLKVAMALQETDNNRRHRKDRYNLLAVECRPIVDELQRLLQLR
ncbi:hypothetical protein B566_EDAN006160 [Ephemera danica]|nr:hypothetical protein B566_EDAN006160 [Ephemera danica]